MQAIRSGRPRAAMWVSLVSVAVAVPGSGAWAAEPGEASRQALNQKLEAAQERLNAAAREVADLSMALSEDALPHVMSLAGSFGAPRSALGLVIPSSRANAADEGVEILSVSPGGPADSAGLEAGDVLVEIDGKSLRREGDNAPPTKLHSAMRGIEPGEKVSLKYLRDGKEHSAQVVARPVEQHRVFNFALPSVGTMPGRLAFMRAEGVFGTAELAPLTPQLGRYFGTEKGLLVVRAPADARLRLEDGDVIVDIDGRVPSNPAHAMRILGSYQAGETVKLNVLRMKKRMNFEVTIPEDVRHRHFEGAIGGPAMPLVPATPGRRIDAL